MAPQLKVSSDRLVKLGTVPATPVQGEWFIHFTTAPPKLFEKSGIWSHLISITEDLLSTPDNKCTSCMWHLI